MSIPPHMDQPPAGFDLREAASILWRHKLLVLAPAAVFATAGWLMVASKLPTYSATAVLILDAHKVRVFEAETLVNRTTTDTAVLRSELDDIASRSTAERVAQRLRATMPPPPSVSPDVPEWLKTGAGWLLPHVKDAPVIGPLVQRLGGGAGAPMPAYPGAPHLLDNLWVSNDGRSLTIEIRYRAHDPLTAAFVANAFADDYLNNQIVQRDHALQEAAGWLSQRLEQLRETLESSELALARYRADQGLAPNDDARPEDAEVSTLSAQLTDVRAQRLETAARLEILRTALHSGEDVVAVADDMGSSLLEELRRREAALLAALDELRGRVTPNHPEMAPLQRSLVDIRRQVDAEVRRVIGRLENDLASLEARESLLEGTVAELRGAQEEGSVGTVRLQQLTREADANRAIYEAFLARYKEMTEQAKIQQPDGRLITPAEPPAKPDPNRLATTLLIALFGGGCIGGGLAFVREHFRRPVRGPDDAEALTDLPVLGLVPHVGGFPFRPVEDALVGRPASALAEALRAAHLTITRGDGGPIGGGGQPKVILVTSAAPREGKSAFCLALARLLAGDGARTLLIDADFRASRISRSQFSGKGPDIVSVLTGEADLAAALRKDRRSAAHYLGARRAIANPQRLLVGQTFRDLIHACRQQYDWVIVDTPPITAVTDAAMIADTADVSLYVVRCNHTSRDLVAAGLRILSMCKVRMTGVVLTGMAGLGRHQWRAYRYYGGAGRLLVHLSDDQRDRRLGLPGAG